MLTNHHWHQQSYSLILSHIDLVEAVNTGQLKIGLGLLPASAGELKLNTCWIGLE